MGYGLEIRIPGVRYNTDQGFPYRSQQAATDLTIQKNLQYYADKVQLKSSLQPLFTEDDEMEWSVEEGNDYCSIDSSTGQLYIDSSAITQMVKVRAVSRSNRSLYHDKEIVITYRDTSRIETPTLEIVVDNLQQQYNFVSTDTYYTISCHVEPDVQRRLTYEVIQNSECAFMNPGYSKDGHILYIVFSLLGSQTGDTTTSIKVYDQDDRSFYRIIDFVTHISFRITTGVLTRDAWYGVDTSFVYDFQPKLPQVSDTSLSVSLSTPAQNVSWNYVNSSTGLSGVVNLSYKKAKNNSKITFRIQNSSLGIYTDKSITGWFIAYSAVTYDALQYYFYKTRSGSVYTDNRNTVYSFNIQTQPNICRDFNIQVTQEANLISIQNTEYLYNTDGLISGMKVYFKLVSPSGNCTEAGTVKIRVYDSTGYLNDTETVQFTIYPKSDQVPIVSRIETPYLDSSVYTGGLNTNVFCTHSDTKKTFITPDNQTIKLSQIVRNIPVQYSYRVYPNVKRNMKVTALTPGITDIQSRFDYVEDSSYMTGHFTFRTIVRGDTSTNENCIYSRERIRIQDTDDEVKYIDFDIDFNYDKGNLNTYNYFGYVDQYNITDMNTYYLASDKNKTTENKLYAGIWWGFMQEKEPILYLFNNKVDPVYSYKDVYDYKNIFPDMSVLNDKPIYEIVNNEYWILNDNTNSNMGNGHYLGYNNYSYEISIPSDYRVSNYTNLADTTTWLAVYVKNAFRLNFGYTHEITYNYERHTYSYSQYGVYNNGVQPFRIVQPGYGPHYSYTLKIGWNTIPDDNYEWYLFGNYSSFAYNEVYPKEIRFNGASMQVKVIPRGSSSNAPVRFVGSILTLRDGTYGGTETGNTDIYKWGRDWRMSKSNFISKYRYVIDAPGWDTLMQRIIDHHTNLPASERIFKVNGVTYDYTSVIFPILT